MTCAGSLFFENLPEQETNDAAKEGTAFGELLAHYLTKPHEKPPAQATNGVYFDDEMKYFANELCSEMTARAVGPILCEERIDWQTRSAIWIKGQYDASYEISGNKLCIDDAKYGYGLIEVKENWQLIGYAIGEVIRRQKVYDRIILRILQPRPHHEDGPYRQWEISYEQLLAYKEQIEARMDKIAGGFAELVTSAKCKYCPATASACTAFNRAVFHGIDYSLTHFQQDDINEKELSHQLDLVERSLEILKIKYDSVKQLAVSRIKDGKIIPNYMTEESYGDRKWKTRVSPQVIETLTGINIVKTEMLSPAQAEKLGVDKELVKTYVERKFIGNKLVRKDSTKLADKIFGKPKEAVNASSSQ